MHGPGAGEQDEPFGVVTLGMVSDFGVTTEHVIDLRPECAYRMPERRNLDRRDSPVSQHDARGCEADVGIIGDLKFMILERIDLWQTIVIERQ